MESKKSSTKNVAAKLDMSLDDLIAASPALASRNGRGRFRGRGSRGSRGVTSMNRVFGGRPMRSFMEIDDIGGGYKRGSTRRFSADRFAGGLNRKREGDLIQKRTPRGNWRGRSGGRFSPFSRRYTISAPTSGRRRNSWNVTSDINFEDGGAIVDLDETMSDGEIPTLPSARRQLILEGRGRQFLGFGRKRRIPDGRMVAISGLDYSILKPDLEELFESIGPIERCWINYDRTDRSLGTGGVIYQHEADAQAAVSELDRRTIDGQELRLELVGGTSNNYNCY